MTRDQAICGVFVGGRAMRMGGLPKGLIRPDAGAVTLVERALLLAHEHGLAPCLVGRATAYADVFPDVPMLADAPPGKGPLGGLMALCNYAGARPVLAFACDMPLLPRSVVTRLAAYTGQAAVLAPKGSAGFWEPLCARYDPQRVLPLIAEALAADTLSLQHLLMRADAAELPLSDSERAEIIDWDALSDVAPGAILPRP